ncbi:MFS transporter [Sphingorhabdus sp.]|jgi:MFS family permease|uniref:MFS transporter n=1 Tax=Sphingorhabdus sp. TaxID=1902408 RepID=UPI0037C6A6BF
MTQSVGVKPAWGLAVLLFAANSFSFVDRMILTLLVEPIKADLGVSDTMISLLHGLAFALFYALAGLPLGWLADRAHRPRLIATGATLWSVMTIATGLARTFPAMFAARAGVAVGEATLSPSAISLLSDRFPPDKSARAIGLFQSGIFVGSALALILGGQLLGLAGQLPAPVGNMEPWRAVFVVAGLPGLVIALLVLFVAEPRARQDEGVLRTDSSLLSAVHHVRIHFRTLGLYILGATVVTVLAYGVLAWMPTVLVRVHAQSQQQVGLALGVANLVLGPAGVLLSAWLLDTARRNKKAAAPATLLLACCLLLGVATAAFSFAPDPTVAIAAASLLIFAQSLPYGIISAALSGLAPPGLRGQIVALYLLISNLAGLTLGPLIVATFTDRLFGKPEMVHMSLALLPLVTLPFAVAALLTCRAGLLDLHARDDETTVRT